MMDNPCYLCNKMYLCTPKEIKKCFQKKFEQELKLKELMEDEM